MSAPQKPLGIRLNNPGNILFSHFYEWKGEDGFAVENGFSYCRFSDAESGLRAIAVLLTHYYYFDECTDLMAIGNRWSGSPRNIMSAYVRGLCRLMSTPVYEPLVFPDVLEPLMHAIVLMENGEQPYTSEQFDAAIKAAHTL